MPTCPYRGIEMTDSGRRFCPRCGTARVGDLPFCPSCGSNLAEFDETTVGAPVAATPSEATPPEPAPKELAPTAVDRSIEHDVRPGGFSIPPFVLVVGIVIVGLLALGLLRLPELGSPAPAAPQASAAQPGGPVAPIVGLSILSPTDGQTLAVKDVLVIGLAPPGLGITQDVSFGLDQHTTADGTGHWAIKVGLNGGDNVLKFRIGDDHSTEKTVRVIYAPPNG